MGDHGVDEYPATLSARLKLSTGDELPVTAFRVGFDSEMMMRYELKAENGEPLDISPSGVASVTLDVLPAHSTVTWPW